MIQPANVDNYAITASGAVLCQQTKLDPPLHDQFPPIPKNHIRSVKDLG